MKSVGYVDQRIKADDPCQVCGVGAKEEESHIFRVGFTQHDGSLAVICEQCISAILINLSSKEG